MGRNQNKCDRTTENKQLDMPKRGVDARGTRSAVSKNPGDKGKQAVKPTSFAWGRGIFFISNELPQMHSLKKTGPNLKKQLHLFHIFKFGAFSK